MFSLTFGREAQMLIEESTIVIIRGKRRAAGRKGGKKGLENGYQTFSGTPESTFLKH